MEFADTIAAPATPAGIGALAIIRVSGKNAFPIVISCLKEQDKFEKCHPKIIGLFKFRDPGSGDALDRVTAIKYCSPRSYSGEDMVEIICHGGNLVVGKIMDALIKAGARCAEKGEFTKRAFLLGKMDLATAESVHGIIESGSEEQLESCLYNYFGKYRSLIERWRKTILEMMSHIESRIQFPDENDVEERAGTGSDRRMAEALRMEIDDELERGRKIEHRARETTIAIVGPPNAGKSSVFNSILRYERSITHHGEGTTRDSISENVRIGGRAVCLVDTAGLAAGKNDVEMMGVERSWHHIENSDLLIWVSAADKEFLPEELDLADMKTKGRLICVINKIDMGRNLEKQTFLAGRGIEGVCISAKTGENIGELVPFIVRGRGGGEQHVIESSIVNSKRQEYVLKKLCNELMEAQKCVGPDDELAAYHLKAGLSALEGYSGKGSDEELLNLVFEKFCIGK
jgi:tRNA modification GTPase